MESQFILFKINRKINTTRHKMDSFILIIFVQTFFTKGLLLVDNFIHYVLDVLHSQAAFDGCGNDT